MLQVAPAGEAARENHVKARRTKALLAGQAASTSCIPNITLPQVALVLADNDVQKDMMCIALLVKLYK